METNMQTLASNPAKTLPEYIIESARANIGQTEIAGNMGFHDTAFQAKMEAVGFKKRHAWCAYHAELVWKDGFTRFLCERGDFALDGDAQRVLNRLFSASVLTTMHNFRNRFPEAWTGPLTTNEIPLGSVMIMQSYKGGEPTHLGHTGVVSGHKGNRFLTIDGNTKKDGESRDGYIVAEKSRNFGANFYLPPTNGLVVLGFIDPVKVLEGIRESAV